jgi:CheY-like chemotaxis protein
MPTLLLVEDSKLLKLRSERILTKAGYHVLTASDGEEALLQARQSLPDIILLDMLLPKLGGEEVLRALKRDGLTTHIPVIVLSGLSQQNEAKLKKEGAAAYFEKSHLESEPSFQLLLDQIDHLLRPCKTP